MHEIGTLRKEGNRFVFSYPELDLTVRGDYCAWVLEAAAEMIAIAEKARADSQVEEQETLIEFGEADAIDLDIAKSELKAQFEIVPQCLVSMRSGDFFWVSMDGREESDKPITRIADMSLTRNDTFLVDEAQ